MTDQDDKPVKAEGSSTNLAQDDLYDGLGAEEVARHLVNSGFFSDTRELSQGVTKILAGREIGIPPVAAMRNFDWVDGQLSMRNRMVAAVIRESDKYDYQIEESSREKCTVTFYDISGGDRTELGSMTWTMDDARSTQVSSSKSLADKDNWQNYPHKMLFWRCISDGSDLYCPDLFYGAYIEDEREVIEAQADSAEVETKSRTEELAKEVAGEDVADGSQSDNPGESDTASAESTQGVQEVDVDVQGNTGDDTSESPEQETEGFDPEVEDLEDWVADHTVDEVKELASHPGSDYDANRVIDAELNGRQRKTALRGLAKTAGLDPDAVLERIEDDGDDEPEETQGSTDEDVADPSEIREGVNEGVLDPRESLTEELTGPGRVQVVSFLRDAVLDGMGEAEEAAYRKLLKMLDERDIEVSRFVDYLNDANNTGVEDAVSVIETPMETVDKILNHKDRFEYGYQDWRSSQPGVTDEVREEADRRMIVLKERFDG